MELISHKFNNACQFFSSKYLLTIIIILLSINILFAQDRNVRFQHIGVDNGLSENNVTFIFQDNDGFLWFGTQNGLVKYDGYSIVVYQPKPDDTLCISSHWIGVIFEDHRNTLWIGTADGLNRFYRTTETFTSYTCRRGRRNSIWWRCCACKRY